MKRIGALIGIGLLLFAGCTVDSSREPVAGGTPAATPPPATAIDAPPTAITRKPTVPEPTPAVKVVPTTATNSTEMSLATDEPTATAVATTATSGVTHGRTTEGAFFHGSPDAPLTLIDYSDFL